MSESATIRKVSKTGNSMSVTIPPDFAAKLRLRFGMRVRMHVDPEGRLIAEPLPPEGLRLADILPMHHKAAAA